jgi:hypothetical protein
VADDGRRGRVACGQARGGARERVLAGVVLIVQARLSRALAASGVENERAPPKRCGGLWCIAAGTRSSLLHRQGAASRARERTLLLRRSGMKESFPGGIASDQAVTRGPMTFSGDLIGGSDDGRQVAVFTWLGVRGLAGASPRGTLSLCCIGREQPRDWDLRLSLDSGSMAVD